jgi:predicted RNA-binding protein YlqC (UPF0109 family)
MRSDVNIEGLVLKIVSVLVDEPTKVDVKSVITEKGTVFQVTVASTDVGKVIGKSGQTARSLRTLLSAMGIVLKTRYELDIAETCMQD